MGNCCDGILSLFNKSEPEPEERPLLRPKEREREEKQPQPDDKQQVRSYQSVIDEAQGSTVRRRTEQSNEVPSARKKIEDVRADPLSMSPPVNARLFLRNNYSSSSSSNATSNANSSSANDAGRVLAALSEPVLPVPQSCEFALEGLAVAVGAAMNSGSSGDDSKAAFVQLKPFSGMLFA